MALDHNAYRVPQCKVTVGNTQLNAGRAQHDPKSKAQGLSYYIEQVNVQVSNESKANSADVTIISDYDMENKEIGGGILKILAAGEKVTIELGYTQTSVVFMGYVNTVETGFSESGVTVSFSCLDARGLLMGGSTWESFDQKKAQEIVKKMLDPLSSYAKSVTVKVNAAVDKEQPLSQNELDDFKYLCHIAKVTNSSFYMTAQDLKFVENGFEKYTAAVKYTWGDDLISFNSKIELSEQVGAVTVMGIDPESAETFSATVQPSANGGAKTIKQLNATAGKKTVTLNNLTVKNMDEAKAYAQALMFETAMKLCTGSAQVLGNEKLEVGKGVGFYGLDPNVDGDYLITSVSHSFGPGGFLTTIGFARSGV